MLLPHDLLICECWLARRTTFMETSWGYCENKTWGLFWNKCNLLGWKIIQCNLLVDWKIMKSHLLVWKIMD
jgi:hypothetical protein